MRTRHLPVGVALLAVVLFAARLLAQAPAASALQPGQASGTFVVEGQTIKITHASAFVDQQDARKPIVLILSDAALPAAAWKSEFDLMRYRDEQPFKGVGFYLDAKREVFRVEYYVRQFPAATMGIFELALDPGTGKTLAGTARSTVKDPKLDVRFRAVLK